MQAPGVSVHRLAGAGAFDVAASGGEIELGGRWGLSRRAQAQEVALAGGPALRR